MTAGRTVVVSSASDERVRPYVEALVAAGLSADAIRTVAPRDCDAGGPAAGATGGTGIGDAMDGAAGLVLCGGCDIAPELYGEAPRAGAGLEVLPARDALEWGLLAVARERRLPVWGVCRGFQLLNAFLGGTLWQDLPLERPSGVAHESPLPRDLLAHGLRVLAPEVPLGRRLLGGGATAAALAPVLVNSRHHQGMKRLAPGLVAVAAAPDGLVEAAMLLPSGGGARPADPSAPSDWWVRGVQWHPENLLALSEQLGLWQDFAAALVPAAAGRRRAAAGAVA